MRDSEKPNSAVTRENYRAQPKAGNERRCFVVENITFRSRNPPRPITKDRQGDMEHTFTSDRRDPF